MKPFWINTIEYWCPTLELTFVGGRKEIYTPTLYQWTHTNLYWTAWVHSPGILDRRIMLSAVEDVQIVKWNIVKLNIAGDFLTNRNLRWEMTREQLEALQKLEYIPKKRIK